MTHSLVQKLISAAIFAGIIAAFMNPATEASHEANSAEAVASTPAIQLKPAMLNAVQVR